eukprot:768142-Hanusia_phi.AAC.2
MLANQKTGRARPGVASRTERRGVAATESSDHDRLSHPGPGHRCPWALEAQYCGPAAPGGLV